MSDRGGTRPYPTLSRSKSPINKPFAPGGYGCNLPARALTPVKTPDSYQGMPLIGFVSGYAFRHTVRRVVARAFRRRPNQRHHPKARHA
jgi:hypothetical protein